MLKGSSAGISPLSLTTTWSSLLSLALLVSCTPQHFHQLHARNIVYDGQIADSYDFVIAGGGTAGLVLASRLSEDANTTVLVLEAGDTGDAVASSIDIPGNAYYTSLIGSSYDWYYKTVPQSNANNEAITWSRGKVLGGSSAINGMYLVRPSQVEVDAWANLIAAQDGTINASLWNWDSLYAAMVKSETFGPPSQEVQEEAGIEFNSSSHGTNGPVHYSYPDFTLPLVGNWTPTLDAVGIPSNPDPDSGSGWGSFIATSSINPTNWTRSYSRAAYIDPLPPRPNLSILPNSTVSKIVFASQNTSQGLNATAVQFMSARGATVQTVNVNKEVILTGGTIGSAQMLMLSGVGPEDVLQAAGVNVVSELPGVGQHLQDHIVVEVLWSTTDETAGSLEQANAAGNPPTGYTSAEFLSFINSATSYANVTTLFDGSASDAATFQSQIETALDTSASTLCPSQDPTVIAGYEAIYEVGYKTILMSPVGQVEILLALNEAGNVAVQAALQHPFSQGRLYITSDDPFDYPAIDPQYLSHSADTVLLRQGLKLARQIGNTAPLSAALGGEVSPGSSVQTDDDWDAWLATQIQTEYHPSCSCAMLPLSQGGVVDSSLKVYGLANVRVADASVFPIQFAAHLQAPTYGLAEQASTIIRAQYNGIQLLPTNSTSSDSSSSSSSSSGSSSSPTTTGDQKTNGALRMRMRMGDWCGSLSMMGILMMVSLSMV